MLNGLSRYIEYDLRQALFVHLDDARGCVLRPHAHRRPHGAAHERPERGAHGRRPGDHVPHEHDLRRRVRARVHAAHRRAAHAARAPADGAAPGRHDQAGRRAASSLRGRAAGVQRADHARAGELRRRARRARVSAGARRDRPLLRAERAVPREEHAPRATLRRDESDVRAARRLERRDRARTRRQPRRARHDHRRRVRRLRLVPRHAHLAADRARAGSSISSSAARRR